MPNLLHSSSLWRSEQGRCWFQMKCDDTFTTILILTAVRMFSILCVYSCRCYKVIFTAVRRRQKPFWMYHFISSGRGGHFFFDNSCEGTFYQRRDKVPWMNFYVDLLFYCCTLRSLRGAAISIWLCTFLLIVGMTGEQVCGPFFFFFFDGTVTLNSDTQRYSIFGILVLLKEHCVLY